MLNYIEQISNHKNKTAIIHHQQSYTFEDLLNESTSIAAHLLNQNYDLKEQRVAFMVNPGFDYVATQWAIWRAGGVVVPLCISHPLSSLKYVIEDTDSSIIIVSDDYIDVLKPLAQEKGITFYAISDLKKEKQSCLLPKIDIARKAMILYTSGTTNLPKGVVSTFINIEAQVSTLIKAWEWTDKDRTLCLLPLHHVHGIINIVCCAMAVGACCEFLDKFSSETVFEIFNRKEMNVFMAVPTIYYKLISYWDSLPITKQNEITQNLSSSFRLMISGSAALPVSVMERWKEISGHTLLERYGMTEIGMAISNPYRGERLAGYVGKALPGVEVRLASEKDEVIENEAGEIQIKGLNVFSNYWQRIEETKKSFTQDGWFKTGDIAILEHGYYKILGRNSTDIIKSGGYKISALEIEEVLRIHPNIDDCAVIGVEDEEWGELVVAALVTKNDLDISHLNNWIKDKIASYKTPRKYIILPELPRNAMGKVTKNEIKKLFKRN
jgi:malonyl-CoA/methylmalonyl-CoA synthetase